MGQQQLLLIVLGVIIVGIAIAVGINMFTTSASNANRDAVINDLNNLAAQAQQWWRKPVEMGGGNRTFNGFHLDTRSSVNANGVYRLSTSASTTADAAPTGADTLSISGNPNPLYIIGWGIETGRNGKNPVKVQATVYPDSVRTLVVN
ncbi:MAG: hypothetical protein ACP5JH_11190 [Bacteroidota bacterium]